MLGFCESTLDLPDPGPAFLIDVCLAGPYKDYDKRGNPLEVREVCEKRANPCLCGTNSQRCYDPFAAT